MDEQSMNERPKVLITGASGFTGKHACIHFLEAGYEIIAVTRRTDIPNNQFQIEQCDITDNDAVRALVSKVKPQYLLHLAGQNHVGQSWDDPVTSIEANAMSTLYLIEALRKESPACRMVVVGSALQFDLHDLSTLPHPYSLSKTIQILLAQAWEKLYKLNIIIAKPSNLIGPGYSNGVCSIFARKIHEMEENGAEKVLEVNNLNALRDFLDVRDAVRAYEILLTKGKVGEIYEIASGKRRSLLEVITCFQSLTSVEFKVQSQKSHQTESPVEITPLKLADLGWQPTFSFEASVRDILDFYRNNKKQ